MSPRRSSRARTTQPSPLIPTQTDSSNSSVTSDRAQRATRSNNKASSPQRSAPRLQSQDDAADDTTKPPPRRTRSGATEIRDPSPMLDDNVDEEEDDVQDENEITRCVCRQFDYPGLCSPLSDMLKRANYEHQTGADGNSVGDFFLQCDQCKVWQHGGCVGIVDGDHSPDEYFCEECRKDLHKVALSPEGQRYSRYAPVMSEAPYRQSPKPDSRKAKGKDSKPRQGVDTFAHKRRQTLNSREQEELERAIEESKRDTLPLDAGSVAAAGMASRPGKRTREESHEYVTSGSTIATSKPVFSDSSGSDYGGENARSKELTQAIANRRKPAPPNKRPRTDSDSPAVEPKAEEASEPEPTETAAPESTPKSKVRGAAARNAKEARDAKERQRQAAANARQARSERRRVDESDNEETREDHVPSTAASSPPPETHPSSSRTSKKKNTPGRRGRGGRTQNREQESPPPPEGDDGLLAANPHNTRARSRSRSVVRGDDPDDSRSGLTPNGTSNLRVGFSGREGPSIPRSRDLNGVFDDGGLLSKPSKVKNFNEKRTSMNEMRKRVAAISEFIGRAQVERPPSKSTSMSRSESEAGGSGSGNTSGANGTNSTNSTGPSEPSGSGSQRKKHLNDIISNDTGPEFGSLTTEEMLENMRLRTQAWQELYGKYGDK